MTALLPRAWGGFFLAALLLSTGCSPTTGGEDGEREESGTPVASPSQSEFQRLQRDLLAWFECEECTEGQLDSVIALGPAAIPSLSSALRAGPAPERLAELQRHLAQRYENHAAYADRNPGAALGRSQAEYIQRYSENFVALYRVRAAIALGAMGFGESRDSLLAADQMIQQDSTLARYDVRRAIRTTIAADSSGLE